MSKMEKAKKEMREFCAAKFTKLSLMLTMACCLMVGSAFAAEEGAIDVSAINAAFTNGFNSMVTNSIAMISAMVPIGLTLAGVVFLVRKGMSWFKGMAK